MKTESTVIEEITTYSLNLQHALNTLSLQLNTSPDPLDESSLKQLLASPLIHLFTARNPETNEYVGMVTLVTFRTPYKMKGTIEDLVVDVSFRGQRLGERLLQAAIRKAKEEGVQSLTLTSNPKRESANKVYQRLGFERYDTNVYKVHLESNNY